ncbi:ATP-dependent 6-phosphofructokinase [bioreactor metagenome]|uniref:6-phosphofructokinase n=1 Tax=bioreactor metagenome TaxID=1076179 RepID=A0A645C3N7_9ZZZZ
MEAIDRIRDTSESHERCSIVEVMGRNAGYIALNTAVSTGADAIIIPEFERDIENIIAMIRQKHQTGRANFIIVVAEGVPGGGERILNEIQRNTNLEARLTILGHIQRGGSPTITDRMYATYMGGHAAHLLAQGIGNRIVGLKEGKIYDVDIFEGLAMVKSIDRDLYALAKVMEK